MTAMPRVCVIVLNYFDAEATHACVNSLLEQPLDALYLVENSADVKQADAIERIRDELYRNGAGFEIRTLINERNLGFGAGINGAIRHDCENGTWHDLYLLLNNDTLLPKNTLEVLLEEKSRRPRAALISPRIDWAGKPMCYRGYVAVLGHVTEKPTRFSTPYLTGCCLLVDADLVNEKGMLFDEDFFMYGEDIWLNWEVRRRGGDIYCTDRVTIKHTGTGSSFQGGIFYEYHIVRGHILLGFYSETVVSQFTYLFSRLFYLTLRAFIRANRYKSFIPIIAFYKALWSVFYERLIIKSLKFFLLY